MATLSHAKITLITFLLFWGQGLGILQAQESAAVSANSIQTINQNSKAQNHRPTHISKKIGHYSRDDWAEAIDQTWGFGEPTAEKLRLFDLALQTIDSEFTAFRGLEVDLDSLKHHYRPEIEAGVSRGRFAAIMNRISLLMHEGHTWIMDWIVNSRTDPFPGVPLFYVDAWTDNTHFGAGLTPLPDSTLLVYKAVAEHPLNLRPGDIVLGYDGRPWTQLMQELWDAELPIYFSYPHSSTKAATQHRMLMAAGMNWHLFDTIDVIKYDTGDTVHLATLPLAGGFRPIWGNEQVPVPGVPLPDFARPVFVPNDNWVSWGVVAGTQIGYIYAGSFLDQSPAELFHAIDSLMHHTETTGLIFDFRLNYGGGITATNPAMALLFEGAVETVGWHRRCGDPNDHFEMCPDQNRTVEAFTIPEDSARSFYNKPIALLTGPGCFSAGDQNALKLSMHPNARVFGKSTGGGFTSARIIQSLGNNGDWFMLVTNTISYLASDPENYLARWGVPVDEEVWLTPDDVAQGRDTVVEAALAWINTATRVEGRNGTAEIPSTFDLQQNFPNPFNPATTISYHLPKRGFVKLAIYTTNGQLVRMLASGTQEAGRHVRQWDGLNEAGQPVGSGIYLYRLTIDHSNILAKKMLLIR